MNNITAHVLWLFLLLQFRFSSVTSASVPCGRPVFRPRFNRIVGGEPARAGTWPWTVMLTEQGYQGCGGTLIHPNWVVTAAHCFVEDSNNASRWNVHAGKHHVYVADPPEQSSAVTRIIVHPNFHQETVENDIALLELTQPFRYTTYVRPSCLVTPAIELYPGRDCVSVGWGNTLGTSDDSVLNQIVMPLIDGEVCRQPNWYGADFYPATMMCAGFERGGKDTCNGDSGGPLVCFQDGVWYLAGVTSWGINCAVPRQPGVYAKVSLYVDWIKGIMAQNGQPYEY